jgi:diguanylate cyclase (GGDEF)-like protein/PAS domain S-box-containing protein
MMQISSLFAQLNEAYILIDQEDASLVSINEPACKLLDLEMSSLEASTLWAQIIRTRLLSEIKTSPINAFHNQRHLVFTPSPITDDTSSFLALHISIATPSEETLHNFFSIVDNLGAYVYCKDLNYNYTYANQQVCELFEKPIEEVIGSNDLEFFGDETGKYLQEIDKPVIAEEQTVEAEEINYIPTLKQYRHYLSAKKPLYDQFGQCCGLFGISTDITEQKEIQKKLFESELKLTTILDNVGAYIFIKDTDRCFTYINRMTEELFQRSSDEIVGMNNFDLLGPVQGEEFDRTDREVFAKEEPISCIETFKTPDSTFYYWSVKIPMRNDLGEIDSYIGISTDITEQKKLEHQVRDYNTQLQTTIAEINHLKDKLQHQATHDVLTGLYNRRFLEEQAEKVFTDFTNSPITILMIDIDHFKKVNDKFGHKTGDDVLQLLAKVMTEARDNNDIVCRYGGEEFLILLPHNSSEQGYQKAEHIRIKYEHEVALLFPEAKENSISIGLASSPNNGISFDAAYQAADKALYTAKHSGRNRTIIADAKP